MSRAYKTISKQKLTLAYGMRDARALVKKIKAKEDSLSKSEKKLLGKWKGHGYLLPDQVQIIVEYILGTPESPEMVYSIEKSNA